MYFISIGIELLSNWNLFNNLLSWNRKKQQSSSSSTAKPGAMAPWMPSSFSYLLLFSGMFILLSSSITCAIFLRQNGVKFCSSFATIESWLCCLSEVVDDICFELSIGNYLFLPFSWLWLVYRTSKPYLDGNFLIALGRVIKCSNCSMSFLSI